MNRLIETPPTDIQYEGYSTTFYFGVKAAKLSELPDGTEFVVVRSPKADSQWHLVRYRTYGHESGMVVIETRNLTSDEMTHFEQLSTTLSGHTGV